MFTVRSRCMRTGLVLRERTADTFPEAVELSKSERKVFSWFDTALARSFHKPVHIEITSTH